MSKILMMHILSEVEGHTIIFSHLKWWFFYLVLSKAKGRVEGLVLNTANDPQAAGEAEIDSHSKYKTPL